MYQISKIPKIENIMIGISYSNTNSLLFTIITGIALIPIIPGGIALALRYLKKVSIKIDRTWMRLYNKVRHDKLRCDIFKFFSGGCELI